MTWLAPVLAIETGLYLSAGFSWFRTQGYSFAEAGAAAIMAVFMVFSLIHQIPAIVGVPLVGPILEAGLTAALIYLSLRHRFWPLIKSGFTAILGLMHLETMSVGVLAATWGVMLVLILLGWLAPGGPFPWAAGVAKLPPGGLLSAVAGAPLTPLNSKALFYHCGRFGLSPGACGFGLLAHLAVGLSTYALARRYAWPPMALTVTLLVVSMPRLVMLGLQPSAELIATAAVTVDLMLLYRLVEQHLPGDLALFLLCTAFSIYVRPLSLGLALVLVLLLLVVMVRRHGWIIRRELLAGRRRWAAVLLSLLFLAQVPVFGLNLAHGHPLFGTPHEFGGNGLLGAAVNLLRYLLLSIDPTEAVRRSFLWLTGIDLAYLVAGIDSMAVAPLAAKAGVKALFTPIFTGGGGLGFGPFLPLLVMVATVHALLRGPRRLKAVCVAWVGYLYLSAIVRAWQPDSLWVLTPLYAANGCLVAFFLPPYRLRRRGMRLLQSLSALLLFLSFYLALQVSAPIF
ncbi:MAG: hypothetical protein P8010_22480 [Desulfosarcinaceae bacterium]|jgi:hypothetical protein